jgi:hypothetical protein
LIGTWVGEPSETLPASAEVTYRSDGTALEITRLADGSQPVAVQTQWAVTNGILKLRCIESSRTDIVPIGLELQDRLEFRTVNTLILRPLAGYPPNAPDRAVRIRKTAIR